MTVAVEDATVRYGSVRGLHRVNVGLEPGEILAVLGPNGAGKTTLLRLFQLLVEPAEGRVVWDGKAAPADEAARLELRRRTARVEQNPAILQRSVLDNVAYPLRLRGVPRTEARRRGLAALARVGLTGLADRAATGLSGGERARLAFARAVATEPGVLLLDEFAAHLDPAGVEALEEEVRRERDRGAAIAVVTHNLFQARRLSDRAVILVDGEVAAWGPTQEVFEGAAEPRARAFVTGEMVY